MNTSYGRPGRQLLGNREEAKGILGETLENMRNMNFSEESIAEFERETKNYLVSLNRFKKKPERGWLADFFRFRNEQKELKWRLRQSFEKKKRINI